MLKILPWLLIQYGTFDSASLKISENPAKKGYEVLMGLKIFWGFFDMVSKRKLLYIVRLSRNDFLN